MASQAGIDIPGVIFLMRDVILGEGVLFAYSAYFRSDSKVRFQIWRPVSGPDDNVMVLISETTVIPSVKMDREDVSTSVHEITYDKAY